ncbi:MAG: hypothetical protein EXR71_09130 [Myxococcales bacterium]|nr:hypothetical protein [Myxococcales bacterium]
MSRTGLPPLPVASAIPVAALASAEPAAALPPPPSLPAAAPVTPERAAPPPVATAPPVEPQPLDATWARVLAALPASERVAVHDVALPLSVGDGTFRIGVRKELWRARVRDQLARVDLAAILPGLRRVDVVVVKEAGSTGREVISAADLERRALARAAAETSEPLRRLMAMFDAELEEVTPTVSPGADDVPGVVEDGPDDSPAVR